MVYKRYLFIAIVLFSDFAYAQTSNLYFPPLTGNVWDTLSPGSLGWCQPEIDTLVNFLDQNHTKAFIIIKDGKIVIEKYFGTFTTDSLWYWASAGKSLTGFLTGIAQANGILNINDSTSSYLGSGWTSCSGADEGLITIKNQLSMTTGLNDINSTNDCTVDSCLYCIAVPGTRWAYHNAPYTLLHPVIAAASGVSINNYTQNYVLNKTGMSGFWFTIGFDDIFFSKARSMARFGLLALNKGIWNGDTLLHDTTYFSAMTNSSQSLNQSYGYLWWLNGKSSFMLPGSQLVFPGSLIPSAPADLIAALGKNDQKIHVVPSMNLVVIRMGDAADTSSLAPTSFDDQLWQKINDLFCSTSNLNEYSFKNIPVTFPNPFNQIIHLNKFQELNITKVEVCDLMGNKIVSVLYQKEIDLAKLKPGYYLLNLYNEQSGKVYRNKIIKN